jgi:hypothetical protein
MGGATAKAREAMIAFLKRGELKPPRAVATAPGKEATGVGFLTSCFDEGSLFLASTSGEYYRLEWQNPTLPPRPDRRRALPPGEYTLTGYRVLRRDAKGAEWFLSATGPAIRRLVVRGGEEQRVRVDETIRLTGTAHPEGGGVEIQLMIAGEKGSGLTLYRDGKRIDIGYRLADARKQELARGALKYG